MAVESGANGGFTGGPRVQGVRVPRPRPGWNVVTGVPCNAQRTLRAAQPCRRVARSLEIAVRGVLRTSHLLARTVYHPRCPSYGVIKHMLRAHAVSTLERVRCARAVPGLSALANGNASRAQAAKAARTSVLLHTLFTDGTCHSVAACLDPAPCPCRDDEAPSSAPKRAAAARPGALWLWPPHAPG